MKKMQIKNVLIEFEVAIKSEEDLGKGIAELLDNIVEWSNVDDVMVDNIKAYIDGNDAKV